MRRRLPKLARDRQGWLLSNRDSLARFCLGIMVYMSVTTTVTFILMDMPEGILLTHVLFPAILFGAYLVVRLDRDRTWAMANNIYDVKGGEAHRLVGSALFNEGLEFRRRGPVRIDRHHDATYDEVFVLVESGLEVVVWEDERTTVYIGPTSLRERALVRRLKVVVDGALGPPVDGRVLEEERAVALAEFREARRRR